MSFQDFYPLRGDTRTIADSHCRDFTSDNVKQFLASKGGYLNYVKSLGGVFTKYADFKGKIKTKQELIEIMEYVWGLYYIWGCDYSNGCNYTYAENRWRAYNGFTGAFYCGEQPSERFQMNYSCTGFANGNDLPGIDKMLSNPDKYYAVVNCGLGVTQVLKKAGLIDETDPDPSSYMGTYKNNGYNYKIIKDAKDLKTGDILLFYWQKIPGRNSKKTIGNWESGMQHTAIVGEKDDTYIWMYDSGHAYTYYGECRNRRKIGDNQVYQWATDWLGVRFEFVEKLADIQPKEGWNYVTNLGWKYFQDGKYLKGWQKLKWSKGENWFYFNSSGVMVKGLQKLKWSKGEDWFYFDENGAMVTGDIDKTAVFAKSGILIDLK